jgi:hypothetical protein
MKHRCKKIEAGKYEYRGYIIHCHGYYPPNQCVVWEVYKVDGYHCDYSGYSKREMKEAIDRWIVND